MSTDDCRFQSYKSHHLPSSPISSRQILRELDRELTIMPPSKSSRTRKGSSPPRSPVTARTRQTRSQSVEAANVQRNARGRQTNFGNAVVTTGRPASRGKFTRDTNPNPWWMRLLTCDVVQIWLLSTRMLNTILMIKTLGFHRHRMRSTPGTVVKVHQVKIPISFLHRTNFCKRQET